MLTKRLFGTLTTLIVSLYFLSPVYAQTAPISATIPSSSSSEDATAPSRPILVRPVDGTVTSNATPELVWQRSDDPNGNYVGYTVYLNGLASYLGVADRGNSAGTGYTSSIQDNEVRLIPTSPLSDGLYRWSVTAYDYALNQASSSSFSFLIDTRPPSLVITKIEETMLPLITEGTIFDIYGQQDVTIAIQTEAYTDVSITLKAQDGTLYNTSSRTEGEGQTVLTQHLPLGMYEVNLAATDRANLTTIHPIFSLNLIEYEIEIPVPGVSPPPTVVIPPFLSSIPETIRQYPATIASISTRYNIAIYIFILLAICILALLILLKYRQKKNN